MRSWHAVLIALIVLPVPSSGQVVVGRVLEERSDTPVAGAQVRLLLPDGTERVTALTDSTGWFQLVGPDPGRYALDVQQSGYVAFTSEPLDIAAGRTTEVEVRLGRFAIPLEPLLVTVRQAPIGRLSGFRERLANEPFGKFVTAADIDRRPGAIVSDLFRTVPGVYVIPVKRGGNPDGMTTHMIMMRGRGYEPAPVGADVSMAGLCRPALFLDGVRVAQSADFPVDDLLKPHMLEGIEVYTAFSTTPPQFQSASDCGAVAAWTREGRGGGRSSWKRMAVGLAGFGLILLLTVSS